MTLAKELEELNTRLAALEGGPAVVGDWHRLDARAARSLIRAQQELTTLQQDLVRSMRAVPPDPAWFGQRDAAQQLRDLIEELRMIRLAAQSRVFEHEAAGCQSDFSNRSPES